MFFYKDKKTRGGFGIIEAVVGIAVISVMIFGAASVIKTAMVAERGAAQNIKSAYLLEEGMEAVKLLRDESWASNIAPLLSGADNYLEFNGTKWLATSSNIYIDAVFERKFRADNVLRDINDDISSSGALDQDTKKITVFVSYRNKSATTTKQISAYITNIFNN